MKSPLKSSLSFKGRLMEYVRKVLPGEQARLMRGSYERVFRAGGATEGDRDRVLTDLAQKAGWGRVSHPKGKNNELYELGVAAGKLEVFGHLYNQLRLSPQEIAALEETVRLDRLHIMQSGDQGLSSQYN